MIMNAQQRKEYNEREAREIEEAKASLAVEYKIPRDAKFDKAWRLAWEYGHSSGLSEVRLYFSELVELIRP